MKREETRADTLPNVTVTANKSAEGKTRGQPGRRHTVITVSEMSEGITAAEHLRTCKLQFKLSFKAATKVNFHCRVLA